MTPPVVDEPASNNDVVVHVNVAGEPAFAFGAVKFEVVVTDVVDVHPLAGFVTVTPKEPTALTTTAAEVEEPTIPEPVHRKATPPVNEEAVKVRVGLLQFKIAEVGVALTPGAVVFVAGLELEQPFHDDSTS